MSNLKIFENEEFGKVRTVEIKGEVYFIAKDVAQALGYKNLRDAINKHVDKEDKEVAKCDSLGGWQKTMAINESGLYSLILSSKLPTAKKFKRWITSEVLPTIRKHGVYATEELLANPDVLIEALQALKKERAEKEVLVLSNKVQEQQIAELKPKATYYDVVLQSNELLTITVIAKDYGFTAQRMNELLHDLKVQFKQAAIWFIYERYADNGYTCTKTKTFCKSNGTLGTKVHTYWTQKGRLFIYGLLKEQGILPMIEREQR